MSQALKPLVGSLFCDIPEKEESIEMSEWVPVCETEGAQPVEIETDDDGTMPLSSIIAHFPGTTTLKFRAPVKIPLPVS